MTDLADRIVVMPVRFNMFHLGHEAYLDAVLARRPRMVYIFLGRCNARRIATDPFDDVERRYMIDHYLASRGIQANVTVLPIFNRVLGEIVWTTERVEEWYGYCAALLRSRGLPLWDYIISGNPYTHQSAPGELRFVSPYGMIDDTRQVFTAPGVPLNATFIRTLLAAGDASWQRWVNPGTARIVTAALARAPMASGPMEALEHRVQIALEALDPRLRSLELVVRDGEFKDLVALEAIERDARAHGLPLKAYLDASEPHRLWLRDLRSDGSPDRAVALRCVQRSGDALLYQYAVA